MDLPDKAAIDGGRTGRGRWQVAWATQVGAMHVAREQLREDAASVHVGDRIIVAAVSDGHGMARSFRAHVGSELAVEAARDVALAAQAQWSGPHVDTVVAATWLREHYTGAVISRWRRLVLEDAADNPLTQQEQTIAPTEAGLFVAYGATLLVALVDAERVLFWQIGDGDLVLAPGGATAGPAVAHDPHLVGNRTTSLCQPDAARHVRTAVHELGAEPCVLVLATDGFGNAMLEGDWQERMGEDLHALVAEDGFEAVARKLPEWAAEASRASGDDVSLVVLVAAGAPATKPGTRAAAPPVGSVPVTALGDLLPGDLPVTPPPVDLLPVTPQPGDLPVDLPVRSPVDRAMVAPPGPAADQEPSALGTAAGPTARRWLVGALVGAVLLLAVLAWLVLGRDSGSGAVPTQLPTRTTASTSATGTSSGDPSDGGPPRGTVVPTVTQSEPTITATVDRMSPGGGAPR